MNIYAKYKLYIRLTMTLLHGCIAAYGIVQAQHWLIFDVNKDI